MSGISSIMILDHKNRVLVSRSYRDDFSYNIVDVFTKKQMELEDQLKPMIMLEDGTVLFHKSISNITILAAAKQNINAAMVFAFIYSQKNLTRLIQVMTDYFFEIEEESIRDNFVVVYELLDEMLDNGYPQNTDVKTLSGIIKTERHKLFKSRSSIQRSQNDAIKSISNVVSWRKEGIKYKNNQVFLDVYEKVNMLMNAQGHVIKSEIQGQMKMVVHLSGMPELSLGLNDKLVYNKSQNKSVKSVELNDLKFHQCVRLANFSSDRSINFIPPDGEFDLLSYRVDTQVKPLFHVDVDVQSRTSSKITFHIKLKSFYKNKCIASKVNIIIPVPSDVYNPQFNEEIGRAKYDGSKEAISWKIDSLPGHKEFLLDASFSLPSIEGAKRDEFQKLPVQVEFEIPYFTVSGIQIKYLKVQDKSGYKSFPWVRYITQHGDYHQRTR